ncbi:MAG: acyltransferase [Mycobacteriales bacterium]
MTVRCGPVAAQLRRHGPLLIHHGWRISRALFLARLSAAALVHDAVVTADLAADVHIAPGAQLEVWPQTTSRLSLGPGVQLGDGALLSLRGGSLEVGAGSQLRRGVTLQVGGRLAIGAGVVVSTGTVLHCAEELDIGDLTIVGEYSTIADSAHRRTPPGVPIHHYVRTAPVRVGSNCWLGARCAVTSGVTIGDQVFVGAHAVVTRDVPAGWLSMGVPARPVRELEVEPVDAAGSPA